MAELQRSEVAAEVWLKERHEREFLDAYVGNNEKGFRSVSFAGTL